MKDYNNNRYVCLFGGGAIRGTAHVGVLKALNELEICPTIIGGSSVGSIVAALVSVGYSSDELAEIFLSVNFELFRDLSFSLTPKFALSKGEVFLEWMRDLIGKKFYGENYDKEKSQPVRFKDIDKNLVIITTKMREFECCEFSTYETPDFEIALAVRISCCMPGLMRAVTIEDNLLVDGDLMKGKPMWYLSKNLKNSSDRILEIRLEGEFDGSDKSPIEYVNGMYTCMTYSETDFIKHIYGNKDRYDYLVIDTGNVVVVDFNYPQEKRQAIIDSGYNQTMSYFKTNLLNKKIKLCDMYEDLLDKIRTVQGFILIKQFNKAKISLAELFIDLSTNKEVIDEAVFKQILKFQKILFSSVKSGLFGYSSCKNLPEVKDNINVIIEDLTQRCKSMNEYISKFSV